jgi:hypothetical protein
LRRRNRKTKQKIQVPPRFVKQSSHAMADLADHLAALTSWRAIGRVSAPAVLLNGELKLAVVAPA